MGREEHPHDPSECSGQRGNDHKGIRPRLEVNDNQKINQHNGPQEAKQQATERGIHCLHLPTHGDRRTLGHLFFVGLQDDLDVARDRTQVTPLGGRKNINRRLNRIVRDHRRGVRTGNGCQSTQHLWVTRIGTHNRDVLEIRQRLDPVLRRLSNDGVGHPVRIV